MLVAALLVFAAAQVSPLAAWANASVAEVERAARRGDKVAALELGERYERGVGGVPCDIKRALRWYSRAARDDRGQRLVYSPAVGRERYGRMVPIGGDEVSPGLPVAGDRLAVLKARRERADDDRRALQCLVPNSKNNKR